MAARLVILWVAEYEYPFILCDIQSFERAGIFVIYEYPDHWGLFLALTAY